MLPEMACFLLSLDVWCIIALPRLVKNLIEVYSGDIIDQLADGIGFVRKDGEQHTITRCVNQAGKEWDRYGKCRIEHLGTKKSRSKDRKITNRVD